MHVLVTSDTLSGTWTYTRELVSGLVSRGMRVTLVSFGEIPLPQQTSWMDHLHGLEYRPTAFRLDWMDEGQQDFLESSAYLTALVKELKPDLLHLNQFCYGNLPVPVPRVVVAHGDLDHLVEGSAWPGAQRGPLAALVSGRSYPRSGHGQRRGGAFDRGCGTRSAIAIPGPARHGYLQRAKSDFLQSLRGQG